ncbi:hypothetical protein EIN_480870 [Entamoeba invadens IP1]|uniref:TLDc domain-containing protein n=1 Tax=Entamoeba invadens IP1 TaxID=370355 RepID=L7FN65_ENTIV|nr:hypothetical protein EIN_480870 [Entamoeba invadens IP1]ELP91158.1 hypothetical protein EIN_480870 [Entamoeba invadens IP1]|eukprot:XP_004257929.1 hypothetical protein EIN_480870 [Entamoeba invadens IP1]
MEQSIIDLFFTKFVQLNHYASEFNVMCGTPDFLQEVNGSTLFRLEYLSKTYQQLQTEVEISKKYEQSIAEFKNLTTTLFQTLEEENNKIQRVYAKYNKLLDNTIELLNENKETRLKEIKQQRIVPETFSMMNSLERKEIEKMSGLQVSDIIFEGKASEYSNIKEFFCKGIMQKEKLCILIEDNLNNKFGGVVYEKITKQQKCICDHKAFIFVLENNGAFDPMKVMLKTAKGTEAFATNQIESKKLFTFGSDMSLTYNELIIKFKCISFKKLLFKFSTTAVKSIAVIQLK